MVYHLSQCPFSRLYTALLLGGEFPNCYGHGDNPETAVVSLKIRIYQLRRNVKGGK